MRRLGPKLLFLVLAAACSRTSADESPIATVRHFLEAMDRSSEEESALRDAYRLLDASAHAELAKRAERAAQLSGRAYEPWQMLAQGRFRLRFALASRGAMRERIEGPRATVIVTGENPGQHAEVPLVREQGHWRVRLAIPDIKPLE